MSRFAWLVAAMMLSMSFARVEADMFRLDERTMDTVHAGYVDLSIDAFAQALGVNTAAVAVTRTDIAPLRSNRRYDYTVATAVGLAFAAGEVTHTQIGAMFRTDEEIVRTRIVHRQRMGSGRRGARIARRLGLAIPHGTNFERFELQRLRLRVVTRVPRR